jgi:hypothetical protein
MGSPGRRGLGPRPRPKGFGAVWGRGRLGRPSSYRLCTASPDPCVGSSRSLVFRTYVTQVERRPARRSSLVRQPVKGWRAGHQQGTPIPVSDCLGPAPEGDRQPGGLPRAASKAPQAAGGCPAVAGRCRVSVGNTHVSFGVGRHFCWSQPCRPRTVNPSRELRRFESFTCHRVRERASDQRKRQSEALLIYPARVSKLPLLWQSSGSEATGL